MGLTASCLGGEGARGGGTQQLVSRHSSSVYSVCNAGLPCHGEEEEEEEEEQQHGERTGAASSPSTSPPSVPMLLERPLTPSLADPKGEWGAPPRSPIPGPTRSEGGSPPQFASTPRYYSPLSALPVKPPLPPAPDAAPAATSRGPSPDSTSPKGPQRSPGGRASKGHSPCRGGHSPVRGRSPTSPGRGQSPVSPSRKPPIAAGPSRLQQNTRSPFYILRKTEDVTDKYRIAEELGHGQFGEVSVAVEKATGKRFAIKSISKRRAETPNFCMDIRTEVEILYHLGGHDNIVRLEDVYEDDEKIHLLQELCEGGDYFQRLLAHGTYSEREAAATARMLLQTLTYCHSLGVVHRDLKPENLLFSDRADDATIKFSDFGLSAMAPQTALQGASNSGADKSHVLLHDPVGSTYYVAPEILHAKGYGKECDIWSLGVIMYIVLGGSPPFDGPNEDKVFEAIMYKPLAFEDKTWDFISHNAKDFIRRILEKDPLKRASIPELLTHSWLAHDYADEDAGPVPDAVVQRLQQFAAMNRFKKHARKVLATFLPEEEVIGLLNLFREMDADGDGVLTLAELRAAMAAKDVRIPEAQAKALLRSADLNADGLIDYEEFLAATVHMLRLDKDELMYKAFRHFDKDRSGFISEEELRGALSYQGGKVDVDAILAEVDSDKDGRINYEEFCNFLRSRDVDAPIGLESLVFPSFKSSMRVSRCRSHFNIRAGSSRASSGGFSHRAAYATQRSQRVWFRDPSEDARSSKRSDSDAAYDNTAPSSRGRSDAGFQTDDARSSKRSDTDSLHDVLYAGGRSSRRYAADAAGVDSSDADATPAARSSKRSDVSDSRVVRFPPSRLSQAGSSAHASHAHSSSTIGSLGSMGRRGEGPASPQKMGLRPSSQEHGGKQVAGRTRSRLRSRGRSATPSRATATRAAAMHTSPRSEGSMLVRDASPAPTAHAQHTQQGYVGGQMYGGGGRWDLQVTSTHPGRSSHASHSAITVLLPNAIASLANSRQSSRCSHRDQDTPLV